MRFFSGPRIFNDRQVIDLDVGLDCIIRLSIPNPRFFYQVLRIAKGQLPEWSLFNLVSIVDHNLAANIITVPVSFTEDRSNDFVHDILFVNASGIMSNDDRLAFI